MLPRVGIAVCFLVLVAMALFTFRTEREYRPGMAPEARRATEITQSLLVAGDPPPLLVSVNPYEKNGYDVSEGKRLYRWFNCNGCHANGGGDIGPALMDDKWIYGSDPRNVYQTIVEGRPNGMPTFRNKIPDAQVWQIVAYVRSMSGLVPFYARPGRNDDLQATPPETMTPRQPPKPSGSPVPQAR
jgi:cytochrome c oxidase cbb3-type subunit III